MSFKQINKIFVGLIIFMVCAKTINAQLTRAQIISGYLYNFGNNIVWNNSNFEYFTITAITDNQELIKELKYMASSKKIQGKKINLNITSAINPVYIKNSQIIFVSETKTSQYMTVFDFVEKKEILLVSENFSDKSYVMINLYDSDDNKLLFEINKPNIINQNLELSDDILLMGGTEIDIAEAYLNSKHTLREMEIQMNNYLSQLDSLKQEIVTSNLKVKNQDQIIKLGQTEIDSQKNILDKQIIELNSYKSTIKEQLASLKSFRIHLNKMKDSLAKNELILNTQNDKIKNSQLVLKEQTNKIDSINKEIENRNIILSNKDEIIGKQQNRMIFLLVIILLTLVFIVLIFIAYRQNRKKSLILQKQKQEINRINEELNENNEELKTALEDLKTAQKQLVQSEKMASLGVLSAGIAHEINNPINFVYAGINSLLRDFEDIEPVITEISKINPKADNLKEKLEYIEKIKEENYFDEAYQAIPEIIKDIKIGADRTAEIVKGLRTFSRTDKGEKIYTNIHESIDTSLLLLKNKYKNHIEIVKNYDNNVKEIKCYQSKMNQVFLNIISNAIDAIEEKGTIWITTKTEKDKLVISVKDNGHGISHEVQKKIFDPFYTTKTVGKGTGLGLSITYGIIEEHDGKITINSEPEKGSEFIIELPIS